MRAKAVVDALTNLIQEDLARGGASRIGFCLGGNIKGGWEGWLQVEGALAVAAQAKSSTDEQCSSEREVAYQGLTQKCDLLFTPARGAPIWVEFKTQRNANYKSAVADFLKDVGKMDAADQLNQKMSEGKQDVFIAIAILGVDDKALSLLGGASPPVRHGTSFRGWRYAGGKWMQIKDSSDQIAQNDIILLVWRNFP